MSDTDPVLSGSLPRPFGKYTLVRIIGRGAMGIVYEARDSALGRRVALKVSIPAVHDSPGDAARDDAYFVREAQMAARLAKHPNLVTVYEAGVAEGRRYLAMEYLDAVPLNDWTRSKSPTLRTRVKLLRDVALAVHHAHEGGVLHRDLKPHNILVDGQGRPYVGDFGMAKQASSDAGTSSSSAGLVVGTPSYMSPEQAQGLKTIDRRTDVYALGAMLYEILVGKPPFPGEMTIVALMRIVQDPIPAPSAASPEWAASKEDKAIEALCVKALAKPPGERPATALAFADRLSQWLGEDTQDRMRRAALAPPAPPAKARPWAPWAGASLLAAAALVLALLPRSSPPGAALPPRDLLRYAEPERDRVSGTWSKTPQGLAGDSGDLDLPWRPAENFDLKASIAAGKTPVVIRFGGLDVRLEGGTLRAGPASIPLGADPAGFELRVRRSGATLVAGGREEAAGPAPDPGSLPRLSVQGGRAVFHTLVITEYAPPK